MQDNKYLYVRASVIAQHEHDRLDGGTICNGNTPLASITIAKKNVEAEDDSQCVDLFAEDNALAAGTGFLLWDASWAIVWLLNQLESPFRRAVVGRRVLELGSGTGLAGLCCAAAGGHVLLTDLPSIVTGILKQNIDRNSSSNSSSSGSSQPQAAVSGGQQPPEAEHGCQHQQREQACQKLQGLQLQHPDADGTSSAGSITGSVSSSGPAAPQRHESSSSSATAAGAASGNSFLCPGADASTSAASPNPFTSSLHGPSLHNASPPWAGAQRVGSGSAASMCLDFTRQLHQQVEGQAHDPRTADVVMSVDTVWLKELLQPVASTMANLLRARRQAMQEAGCVSVGAEQQHSPQQEASAPQQQQEQEQEPALPVGFLAFAERAQPGSQTFSHMDDVVAALEAEGCTASVLYRGKVPVPGQKLANAAHSLQGCEGPRVDHAGGLPDATGAQPSEVAAANGDAGAGANGVGQQNNEPAHQQAVLRGEAASVVVLQVHAV